MTSIVIPAHNEAQVIRRTLEAFVPQAEDGEFDVVVVCNGCADHTADIAREFAPRVRVIETDLPSKTNALNLGDQAAVGFPRVYLDADVTMSLNSLRRLAAALSTSKILAAAPAVDTIFKPESDWSVRAYYRFWMSLPFVKEGMMAAGVYAVSEEGRKRFGRFPDVIADDGYVRLAFEPAERIEVADAISRVVAPARFMDLVRIKTRSRLGVHQLRARFPGLFRREQRSKRYGQALASVLRRPDLYLCAIPFLAVSVISRYRANRQKASMSDYRWEVDASSRA
jgi:glycosyltransferase involved in cell wall biosynthesis